MDKDEAVGLIDELIAEQRFTVQAEHNAADQDEVTTATAERRLEDLLQLRKYVDAR